MMRAFAFTSVPVRTFWAAIRTGGKFRENPGR
jgi:hypothetical protein